MRRYLQVMFASALVLALAQPVMTGEMPGTGIENTSHDLTRVGSGVPAGMEITDPHERICFYCHTPHHAMTPVEAASGAMPRHPVWSRGDAAIASFPVYTIDMDTVAAGQPGQVSRICLSCHDGSIASNMYGHVPPRVTWNVSSRERTGEIRIGDRRSFLLHHHPIGFDYSDVGLKDDEIKPATSVLLGANTHGMTIQDLLWSGRIECSSCHDVHNTQNEGFRFMWVDDERSKLCFTCHRK